MIQAFYFGTITLVTAVVSWFGAQQMVPENKVTYAGFSDPFLSIQLANSPIDGDCLSTDGTNNTWTTCAAGGGGSGGGTWSTTTSGVSGQLFNYPNNADDIVLIGSNSSTTAEWFYDPNVFIGYIKGKLGIGTTSPWRTLSVTGSSDLGNNALAGYFTATSTTASSLPYASSTALTISNAAYFPGSGIWNASGNVGIGITAPLAELQIGNYSSGSGEATNHGRILIEDNSTGPEAVGGIEIKTGFGGSGYGFKLYTNNSTDMFGIASRYNASTWTSRLTVSGANGTVAIPLANITKLSNLTGNGLVKTSGGDGTLGTAANGTDYTLISATTCGGTDKVSAIDASGNVTCSADQSGAGGGVWPFTTTDTNYGVAVQSTTTPEWFKSGLMASTTSYFSTASTTALSVFGNAYLPGGIWNSSGNVGIGTTSPAFKLEIGDAVAGEVSGAVTNSNNGASGYAEFKTRNGYTSADALRMITTGQNYNGTGALSLDSGALIAESGLAGGLNLGSNYSFGPIRFFTAGTAATNERMKIDWTGNIGIGTTSPYQKLSVAGGNIHVGGIITSTSTTAASTFPYASTTALSATSLCLTSDCRTSWPASSAVGGSDAQVQFNDGGSALGGDAGFTYNKTADRVTVTYASTTQVSADRFYAPLSNIIALSATSSMGTGTTTRKFAGFTQDWTLSEIACTNIGSGTFNAQLGSGTASTTMVTSQTGDTLTFTTISANNTFSRGQAFYMAFGTVSGAVSQPSCSINRTTR